MAKKEIIICIFAVSLLLALGAGRALAEGSPPPIPSFTPAPPTGPTTTDTTTPSTTTTTSDSGTVAGTTTAAASTASKASSGPKEIVAIVGLALVAAFSFKKYNQSKKYSL